MNSTSGRYVILEHDHPDLHWDLMLEQPGGLRTWRLSAPPAADTIIAARALDDHRHFYLDYEGPVSRGRGTVTRWDSGSYQQAESAAGRIRCLVQGVRLAGRIEISDGGSSGDSCFHYEPHKT